MYLRIISPKGHYKKLYSTGSSTSKLQGTPKIDKIDINGKVDDLPIRSVISYIGTATYHLELYLVQLLKPLSECPYTVKNTKEFAKKIWKQKIPKDYTMVSFDAVSFFTNVPIEDRIKIIYLKKIY